MRSAAICGLCMFLTGVVRADDWPQFLGPNRDGSSAEKGLLYSWPKDGPKQLWKKAVGEGYSGPVIAGTRLIVFHRLGDEEVAECWRADNGESQWKFAYPSNYQDALNKGNGPRSTPVIAGNSVVTLGAAGDLTCLDLESGKKLWAKKLTAEYRVPESFFGIATSPVVDGGLVLVNVGARDAGIVAFHLVDGKQAWKATSDGASYSSPIVRTVKGVKHAVFFTREGPVILDPKTGDVRFKQRWRARYDASVNAATPLLIDDRLFFSASYETGALLLQVHKDNAKEVWSDQDIMSNHYNTCIVHDGNIFGIDGRQEQAGGPSLRCVSLKDKKVRWELPRFGCASMILTENKILAMTERGELVALSASPADYTELARAKLLENGPARAQMALANRRLYLRDQRNMICLNMNK